MKFTHIAIVMTTACDAVRLLEQSQTQIGNGTGGYCEDLAMKAFVKCDANGDEHITWKEALLCGVPAKFHKEFLEHAGKDKELDRPEFVTACREHASGLAELEDVDDHDHGDEFA